MDAVGSSSLETVSRLSLKKAVRSFTTLGGRDFVFICCDGQITHFVDYKVNRRGFCLCQVQGMRVALSTQGLPSLSWHIFDYKVPVKIRV